MRKVAYVSGPVTGVENYREAFDQVCAEYREAGYLVINPCDAFGSAPPDPGDYEKFMRFHVASILTADLMVMLPGWEHSRGACFEKALADMIGLAVVFVEEPT